MEFDTVKAGRPLIDVAKGAYYAGVSLLLSGRHGTGKSEILHRVAEELGIGCVVRDLSQMEPPDLTGLPRVLDGRTVYSPPSFLPTGGAGLFVLEELNRAPRYMQTCCLQLLTARRLNDYVLPEGWMTVASINPPNDEYDVDELDPALRSRFVIVNVVPDRREFLHWAAENDVHPDVMAYVDSDPSVFVHPDSNPRAWVAVSSLLNAAPRTGTGARTLRKLVGGAIGKPRAAAFFEFLRDPTKPFTAEQIFAAYGRHERVVAKWVDAGRLDLIEATLDNVLSKLQAASHFEQATNDTEAWSNLRKFLATLPGDFQEYALDFLAEHGHTIPDSLRQ